MWSNYNIRERDNMIQTVFKQQLANRYQKQYDSQYAGLQGNTKFIMDSNCFYAYKKFLC